MRVLLDTRNLALAQGTGIKTYARNVALINAELGNSVDLLYEFYRPAGIEPILEEASFFDPQYHGHSLPRRLLFNARVGRQILRFNRPIRAKPVRRSGFVDDRSIRHQLPYHDRILTIPLIYRLAWKFFSTTGRFLSVTSDQNTDVAHWTAPHPIYMPGAKNIYTIHDVIPLKLPFTTHDNLKKYARMIRGVVRIADQIISVSENTTKDLLELEPTAEHKITLTYQAVQTAAESKTISQDESGQAIETLFGVARQKYFLLFSAIEPKKNVGRLIEAYLTSNSPYPLLIVGQKGWLYEGELKPLDYQDVKARIRSSQGPAAARVVRIDFVSDRLLVALIRSARAVLFPSIYEGFGLPILEAMTYGAPVMTSNFGAMKEIATSEAALLVDPFNIREMARSIETLARDDELCMRLSAAGLERAKAFSWESYRGKLANAYARAMGGKVG